MKRPWPALALAGATALLACQGKPETSPSLVLTSSAPPSRTLVVARKSPTPAPRPSIAATPPRDVNPPLPPSTPAPVPSPTGPGGAVGGPTPQPAATPTPSLALTAGLQPSDTWLPGPTLRRPRAGLVAGVLAGALMAIEGAPRPSLETLGAAEGTGAAWRLAEGHDPHLSTNTFLDNGISLMAAAVTGTTLLTAGGADGGLTGTVARYGAQGFIDRVATLAVPVKAAAGGQIDGTLVVAGGLASDGPTDGVQRLVVATGGVTEGLKMPTAVAGAASAVLDGKLWVIGGFEFTRLGELVARTGVMVYDPAANTWRATDDGLADPPPALPEARHSGAAAVVDGRLFVVGGVGTGGGLVDTVLVLDRSVQPPRWRPLASLPTPRALLGLAAFDGRLWAIGGRGGDGQPSTVVEVYRP